jgi:hypothetical protein
MKGTSGSLPERGSRQWVLDRHALPVGLWWLSVCLPLLRLLRKNPDFFKAQGLAGWNALAMLGLLLGGLALLLHLPFWAAARSRWQRTVWLAELAIAVWLYQAAMLTTLAPLPGLLLVTLATWPCLAALLRWRGLRSAVTAVLALAWLVCSAAFALAPEVAGKLDLGLYTPPRHELQLAHKSTPVIFWLFDEFPVFTLMNPGGEIDPGQFPNFARLAAASTWYRVARAEAGETLLAVPPLLSGRRSTARGGESLLTLFEHSHRCVILDRPVALAPPARALDRSRLAGALQDLGVVYLHLVAPRVWADRFGAIDQSWVGFGTGEKRYEQARLSIADLHARPAPLFFFMHNLLPHGPWRYREHGRVALPTALSPESESYTVSPSYAQHYLQAQAVDDLLGKMLDRLVEEGLWDDCLFVLVADHGRSFVDGEKPRSTSGRSRPQTLYVPLFVKAPGQTRGRKVDQEVSLLDVVPLMLSLLGAQPPWTFDGQVPSQVGPPSPVLAQLTSLAAAKYRRYAMGKESSVYCSPQAAELWGKPLSGPPAAAADGLSYELVNAPALAAVDLGAPSLPLDLEIRLSAGRAWPPARLLWTLNGKVASVTPWAGVSKPGLHQISCPVPAGMLRDGANDVALYLLEGEEGQFRWRPVPRQAAPSYRLDPDDGELWQGKEQRLAVLPGEGGSVRLLLSADGNWKLQLETGETSWSKLLIFWASSGELLSALPAGPGLTLRLPEQHGPRELKAFLLTPAGARPLKIR